MMTGETPRPIERGAVPKPGQRIVAARCPVKVRGKQCTHTFPCKKRGDWGTYERARYEIHLRQDHKIFLPRPQEVWGF